ncbi:MAG: hypothetical protein L6Q76_14590 [Polyangiaceae bacterium]|nr:hypothetical protein [Polyangiaceae bacterium]
MKSFLRPTLSLAGLGGTAGPSQWSRRAGALSLRLMLVFASACTTASAWHDEDGQSLAFEEERGIERHDSLHDWESGLNFCSAPVVENCSTPANENCDDQIACTGTPLEIRRFGAAGMQMPRDAVMDADGNAIIVGTFSGALDFGDGLLESHETDDIFIVKLDRDGAPVWSRSFGDDKSQFVHRVAVDADQNIVMTGHFRGTVDFGGGPLISAGAKDVFLVKLDASGNHVWSKSFGDDQDQVARGVAADQDGNVFIAGTLWGSADFGNRSVTSAGWDDIFVVKLDKNGDAIWTKTFGDQETQEAWDIATDREGNVIMTGFALGNFDFGDGPTAGAGMPDAVLVKLDGNGITRWSRRFGDGGMQFGQSVAVDSKGNIVMTGQVHGSIDFGDGPVKSAGKHDIYIAKFSPDGDTLWHRELGDAAEQTSVVVTIDGADAVLVTGSFEGRMEVGSSVLTSAGGNDAFVIKLDPDGGPIWSRRMGDADFQEGSAIMSDSMGNVLVTGRVMGGISLGRNLAIDAGADMLFDVFLAAFKP